MVCDSASEQESKYLAENSCLPIYSSMRNGVMCMKRSVPTPARCVQNQFVRLGELECARVRQGAGNVKARICICGLAACLTFVGAWAGADEDQRSEYWVKLVCESSDRIVTVKFGPSGAQLVKTTDTRILESDISGPHGIAISPDRETNFVSIGHGRPYGTAVKYSARDDKVVGQVALGLFPATEDVSPDGNFLFVVNFNLHGDMVPSSVSVVDTAQMLEVARIPTCVMPHGSRVSPDGKRQYSGCMMDDLLVEIDAERMKLARTFRLSAGKVHVIKGIPPRDRTGVTAAGHGGMNGND